MSFDLDISEASATLGYISGVAASIMDRTYLDSVIEYTSDTLAAKFAISADAAARMSPNAYFHMYEWGREYGSRENVGIPQRRLWKLVSTGNGAHRVLGFTFLPSTRPVPIEPELLVPGKKGRTVNTDVHIFTWSALVMEQGLQVTLMPKLTKNMAFVASDGTLRFTSKTIRTNPGEISGVAGNFTNFYRSWWASAGPSIFENEIKPGLEFDIVHPRGAGGRFVERTSPRLVRADQAVSVGLQSYTEGMAKAKATLKINKMNYIGRARARRLELYGY